MILDIGVRTRHLSRILWQKWSALFKYLLTFHYILKNLCIHLLELWEYNNINPGELEFKLNLRNFLFNFQHYSETTSISWNQWLSVFSKKWIYFCLFEFLQRTEHVKQIKIIGILKIGWGAWSSVSPFPLWPQHLPCLATPEGLLEYSMLTININSSWNLTEFGNSYSCERGLFNFGLPYFFKMHCHIPFVWLWF